MNLTKFLREAFKAGFNYSDDMSAEGFTGFLNKYKEAISYTNC